MFKLGTKLIYKTNGRQGTIITHVDDDFGNNYYSILWDNNVEVEGYPEQWIRNWCEVAAERLCSHNLTLYQGLIEAFKYCKDCGKKESEINNFNSEEESYDSSSIQF
jgi:hypothetical protein